MKGIVFTEFLEMVEKEFGDQVTDQVIVESGVESEGAYTAIGTYDHMEMRQLVAKLAEKVNAPESDLYRVFGRHLFTIFASGYGTFFEGVEDSFPFLESIDNYIHREVLKLYPDAELPQFITERIAENELQMTYISERGMYDFAQGLIEGCLKHFNDEHAEITLKKVSEQHVIFNIRK